MSIFTINRQSVNFKGGGLPFYTAVEHQDRYHLQAEAQSIGIWQVPASKLPTTQIWLENNLVSFSVMNAESGTLVADIDIPSLMSACVMQGAEQYNVHTIQDKVFATGLTCGTYYYRVLDDEGNEFDSEIFEVMDLASGGNFALFESHLNNSEVTFCSSNFNLKATIVNGTILNVTHSTSINTVDTTRFDDICITGTTPDNVYFYFDVQGTNGITMTYVYKLIIDTITTYTQIIQ